MEDARPGQPTMNRHEQSVFNLLKGMELKADHPITVLNPTEWFVPHQVNITDGKIWVSGRETCWFALHMCIVRARDPHMIISDLAAERLMQFVRPDPTVEEMLLIAEENLHKRPEKLRIEADRMLDEAERRFNDGR